MTKKFDTLKCSKGGDEMAQVRTRKRGKTFSYIFEAGKTNEGKRKVVEKGGFATRGEAYNAGVTAYMDFLHGNIGITSEKITLNDFMEQWLKNVAALNVKAGSLQTYNVYLKVYIKPYIGNKPVQEMKPADIDKFMRELTVKGFSRNTLSAVHRLLSHALDYAVYPAQMILSNPAKYVKVSKKAPKKVIQRHIITNEKFAELIEKYPFGTPMHIPFRLLFHTGMRIGEVCGLCWNDINFEKKEISLKRQLVYIAKNGRYFSTPKTESSVRKIIIDDVLNETLKHWKAQQEENEQKFGDRYVYVYTDSDNKIFQQSKSLVSDDIRRELPLCTYEDGRLIWGNAVGKFLRILGLNAHSFRHTHATMLIENGASPKGVAED